MDTKIKGYCINFNNNCRNADNKLPVEVDISADFVCPECQRDLIPIGENSKRWKKQIIIFSGLALLTIIVWLIVLFFSNTKKPEDSEIITKDSSVAIVKKKPKIPDTSLEDKNTNRERKDPNSSGNTAEPSKPREISGVLNLPNGDKYIGKVKNGTMNGMGTYYYKSRKLISPKDKKKRYAEVGDYIEGYWYDGKLMQGELFGPDSVQKETIWIGR